MRAVLLELLQLALTVAVAPLVTGLVRWVKARLNARRGPSLVQPYRDLVRLLRKEVVLAENASWLFRVSPYLIFTAVWFAAAIVPTFATGLALAPTADLIALVALLGSARFLTNGGTIVSSCSVYQNRVRQFPGGQCLCPEPPKPGPVPKLQTRFRFPGRPYAWPASAQLVW